MPASNRKLQFITLTSQVFSVSTETALFYTIETSYITETEKM